MKAIVMENYGASTNFLKQEIPTPIVEVGKVLLKVKATSVNPIDIKLRSGLVKKPNQQFPMVLHSDFSGIVTEIAEDVSKFQVGDEVFGFHAGGGALGEYLLVDEEILAKKPNNLTFAEAATLPTVAITAWEALVTKGNIQSENHILIHGGTGGVGHIAIQLAKIFGAKVTTTISTEEKAHLATKLGADQIIFYKEETVTEYVNRCTEGNGFDVVFDTVGGENLDKSFVAVKEEGEVLAIATRSTHDLTIAHNKGLNLKVIFILLGQKTATGRKKHGEILGKIADYVEQGKLKPQLFPVTFTYDQIGEAHRFFEQGNVKYGKLAAVAD